jgi:LAO/AO transport system kinase
MITEHQQQSIQLGYFTAQRARQNRDWMHQLINELLLQKLDDSAAAKQLVPLLEQSVENQTITPLQAAQQIVEQL